MIVFIFLTLAIFSLAAIFLVYRQFRVYAVYDFRYDLIQQGHYDVIDSYSFQEMVNSTKPLKLKYWKNE